MRRATVQSKRRKNGEKREMVVEPAHSMLRASAESGGIMVIVPARDSTFNNELCGGLPDSGRRALIFHMLLSQSEHHDKSSAQGKEPGGGVFCSAAAAELASRETPRPSGGCLVKTIQQSNAYTLHSNCGYIAAYTLLYKIGCEIVPPSSPLLHVLRGRTGRVVRRGEVALVECADLIGGEGPNDRVQHAAVMKKNEVLLTPGQNFQSLAVRRSSIAVTYQSCG